MIDGSEGASTGLSGVSWWISYSPPGEVIPKNGAPVKRHEKAKISSTGGMGDYLKGTKDAYRGRKWMGLGTRLCRSGMLVRVHGGKGERFCCGCL